MSLATNWGYTISGDTLPDLITVEEFNAYTANKHAGDTRIASEIKAASQAVRNYCGWHVAPAADCIMAEHLLYGNGRVKRVGRDLLIQLPARYVSAVSSVTVDGVEYSGFACDADGIIHVFDVPAMSRKSVISVEYNAGIPDSMSDSIKEILASRINHALSTSVGVTSETAGGMSVTYSAGWANSARASALPDDSKEALSSYRVQGVF